jgi:PAS domain S-box-containing protein
MISKLTLMHPDLEAVIQKLAVALVITDVEGTVLYFNKEANNYRTLTSAPLETGSSFFDLVPSEWKLMAEDIVKNVISSKTPTIIDASSHGNDGKTIHVEIRCNCIMDASGEVTQLFLEARDVTPRKIFEKKITSVAQEYSDLIETANAVIIGTDSQGYITDWNGITCRITGYAKDQAFAQKFQDILLDKDTSTIFSAVMDEVLKGNSLTNYELPVKGKGNKDLVFLINATPKRNVIGDITGVLLIGQDHTELIGYRKYLEMKILERTEALKEALQKEKEMVEVKKRFVAIASHEFRSPLSSIASHVESLKENIGKQDITVSQQRLDSIQTQVKHMSALLEDLLMMGKSESGRITATVDLVDLKDFFSKVIDEVVHACKHSHRVITDFPSSPVQIQSDPKLLRNIFINLLTNAMKFSPNENEVFLSMTVQDEALVVRVKDKGIGIEPTDIEKVFEPFTRGDNAKEIKGTGLGLSIVRKAVETLGGKIQVESTTGKGTVFTIKLNLTNRR